MNEYLELREFTKLLFISLVVIPLIHSNGVVAENP